MLTCRLLKWLLDHSTSTTTACVSTSCASVRGARLSCMGAVPHSRCRSTWRSSKSRCHAACTPPQSIFAPLSVSKALVIYYYCMVYYIRLCNKNIVIKHSLFCVPFPSLAVRSPGRPGATWAASAPRWKTSLPDATVRSAQVRAQDDRAQCWNIDIPHRRSLCPVILCPDLCSSEASPRSVESGPRGLQGAGPRRRNWGGAR